LVSLYSTIKMMHDPIHLRDFGFIDFQQTSVLGGIKSSRRDYRRFSGNLEARVGGK